MILKGNVRGSGEKLANHLTNANDNDHIEIYQVRGFATDDFHDAILETEAISKGTRSHQPYYSLSVNPPADQYVTYADSAGAPKAIKLLR